MDWKEVIPFIQQLDVLSAEENELVQIRNVFHELKCIGRGTDAAVFVHPEYPLYAFKVYAKGKTQKQKNEEAAYEKLGDNAYFPTFYGSGEGFIVMSYEQGINLYDCLAKGIEIPEKVVDDVERAIEYARGAGLNPRDIHLKNILLQGDKVKLIDISEYVNPGNDGRWEHLKEAYRLYYPLIASRRVPVYLIEFIKKQYQKHKNAGFSVKKFGRVLMPLFFKQKKGKTSL
jgi:predicted Ser/Thr protein kinase